MALTAIHPGELAALHMSATELARQLDVPPNRITEILNSERAITGDTALRLAHFFGTSAEFWLNLQSLYELRLAARKAGSSIKALPKLNRREQGRSTRRIAAIQGAQRHHRCPLFHCSTVPLFHCSTVPLLRLSHCSDCPTAPTVPLFYCSTVPLFHCSPVPFYAMETAEARLDFTVLAHIRFALQHGNQALLQRHAPEEFWAEFHREASRAGSLAPGSLEIDLPRILPKRDLTVVKARAA